MTSAIDNAAGPDCSEGDGTRTSTEMAVGTRDDADGPKRTKDIVDITTSNKTNRTLLLVSY